MAFGQPVNTYYDFAKPTWWWRSIPISWLPGPASLRYARQFAARRRVRGGQTAMNRLYVVGAHAHAHRRQGRPSACRCAPAISKSSPGALATAVGSGARRTANRRQRRHL